MMTLAESTQILKAIASSEWTRLAATVVMLVVGAVFMRIVGRLANQAPGDVHARRLRMVGARNTIIAVSGLLVLVIWGSKLAGFVLSIAALMAALVLASKELLLNFMGAAVMATVKPCKVGDFVEINGIRGRVQDTGIFGLTVTETLEANQFTGKTTLVPNAWLLSHPVKNVSATGRVGVFLMRVGLSRCDDAIACADALAQAASAVCAPWLEDAARHLARRAREALVDLPGAEPRVLFDLSEERPLLLVRFACDASARVDVEQQILRRYLATRPDGRLADASWSQSLSHDAMAPPAARAMAEAA